MMDREAMLRFAYALPIRVVLYAVAGVGLLAYVSAQPSGPAATIAAAGCALFFGLLWYQFLTTLAWNLKILGRISQQLDELAAQASQPPEEIASD